MKRILKYFSIVVVILIIFTIVIHDRIELYNLNSSYNQSNSPILPPSSDSLTSSSSSSDSSMVVSMDIIKNVDKIEKSVDKIEKNAIIEKIKSKKEIIVYKDSIKKLCIKINNNIEKTYKLEKIINNKEYVDMKVYAEKKQDSLN
jgi:hypothetical protein